MTEGVITPNQIPLTTIVTYLQKSYRSRISNHWVTIPVCSVVPPIYKQSKKTYCHILFLGVITPNQIPLTTIVTYLQKGYRSRISNHWATIPAYSVVPLIYKQSKKTYCHILFLGVITPNQIPLTTIVTYLQKVYRSRISNHWATIPACSVVPPIYKQSKQTYCHF